MNGLKTNFENYKLIAGTDEAGRGCLCGSVFAAAVILDRNKPIANLNDSKKLPSTKRENLAQEIKEKALCFAITKIDNKTIDKINILQASLLAMKTASENLERKPEIILIDGNKTFISEIATQAIIKGDATYAQIAAASILAKVARDAEMQELNEKFPQYKLDKHKGYPTKEHLALLQEFGIAKEIYRLTYKPVASLLLQS